MAAAHLRVDRRGRRRRRSADRRRSRRGSAPGDPGLGGELQLERDAVTGRGRHHQVGVVQPVTPAGPTPPRRTPCRRGCPPRARASSERIRRSETTSRSAPNRPRWAAASARPVRRRGGTWRDRAGAAPAGHCRSPAARPGSSGGRRVRDVAALPAQISAVASAPAAGRRPPPRSPPGHRDLRGEHEPVLGGERQQDPVALGDLHRTGGRRTSGGAGRVCAPHR